LVVGNGAYQSASPLQVVEHIVYTIMAIVDLASAFNRSQLAMRSGTPRDAALCATPIGRCPLPEPQIEGLICQCTSDRGNRIDGETVAPSTPASAAPASGEGWKSRRR